jgi:hypothetical protein
MLTERLTTSPQWVCLEPSNTMDNDVEKELAQLRLQFAELASSVAAMQTDLNDVVGVIRRLRAVEAGWQRDHGSPVSQQH